MVIKIKEHIKASLERGISEALESGGLQAEKIPGVMLEAPKLENHGDISSNICFLIGKENRINPGGVAARLLETEALEFGDDPYIQRIEAAGPGFLNFFLKPSAHRLVIQQVLSEGGSYGSSCAGAGEKILVEFVSANPTGPLHIGHARNAVVGDVLSRILEFAGHTVTREYYLNDAGRQVEALGASLRHRYMEAAGRGPDGEPEYRGDYLSEVAAEILEEDGGEYREHDGEFFSERAVEKITRHIREDLEEFSVAFDSWFSEKNLHRKGMVERAVETLRKRGAAVEREGAVWFLSSKFGDEKDRVIIRKNGFPTYLASDIAYHGEKIRSGYDRLINVLGADHHGYVPRLKGVVQAMGGASGMLEVVLIQLVKLLRAGKPVPMSTRAGEFVSLREVLEEVGSDALRFFMLMRRSDAQLDFDIELAKKHSVENPVYYVQYAHARISSLERNARESGIPLDTASSVEPLNEEPEILLMKKLALFPEVIEGSANTLEPQRLTAYLQDTASAFHNFYDRLRVVGEEDETARATLLLAEAARIVISNGLGLLGVSCPDKM